MLLALSGIAAAASPDDPAPTLPVEAPAGLPAEVGEAPAALVEFGERGRVSWYGHRFRGRRTACGVPFDPNAYTMAHPSLPCGTRVRVTNVSNGRQVMVTVNDRGPFFGGRIGDLSRAAARRIGIAGLGWAVVVLEPVVEVP